MPAWLSAGVGLMGLFGGGGSSGSTGGSGPNMYVPTGLGGADTGWQNAFGQNQGQLNYSGGPIPYGGLWGNQQTFNPGQGSQGAGINWGGMGQQSPNMTTMPVGGSAASGGGGGQGFPGPSDPGWGSMDAQQNGPVYNGPIQQYQGMSQANAPSGAQTGGGGGGQQATGGGFQGQGGGLAGTVDPLLYATLQQQQGIDYNPLLNASQQAGQQYQGLSNLSGQLGGTMMGLAGQELGQMGQLQQQGQQLYNQGQNLGQQSSGLGYGQLGQMQGLGGAAIGAGQQQLGQMQGLGGASVGLGMGQLGQMQGLAGGLQGAGQQAYQTGFDPQNALYDRTRQQLMDQTGAVNSMYGLGSSGAGAGMADQALSNFNIDWQNQQQQRQLAGLQGMMGANQAAGGLLGQGYAGAQGGLQSGANMIGQGYAGAQGGLQSGANMIGQGYSGAMGGLAQSGSLATQGSNAMNQLYRTGGEYGTLGSASLQAGQGYFGQQPGYTMQGAQTPLQAQQQVAGMPAQNASQYATGLAGAMTPYNQQMNQAVPYMNYGSGAGANAFQNSLAQNQFNANQQYGAANSLGNALGSGGINWGSIAGAFGNQGTTTGTPSAYIDPYGQQYNNPSGYTGP